MVWIGLLAPAGTPPQIINRMSAAIAQVAKTPEIIGMRKEAFSDSVGSTPAEFSKFLDDERAKWGAVIKKANVKIQ